MRKFSHCFGRESRSKGEEAAILGKEKRGVNFFVCLVLVRKRACREFVKEEGSEGRGKTVDHFLPFLVFFSFFSYIHLDSHSYSLML